MPTPPSLCASALAALLALGACSLGACSAPSNSGASSDRGGADTTLTAEAVAAYPTPSVVLIGRAGTDGSVLGGGQLFLRFRGSDRVVLSPAPLTIATGSGEVEAPHLDGPHYSREGDAVVTAATYALDRNAFLAVNRSGEAAEVTVQHANEARTYPLVRADLLEQAPR